MEYCLARRISGTCATAGASRPSSAALPASALRNVLKRMVFPPEWGLLFFFGCRLRLSGRLDFGNAPVPVENLLAVPVQHAVVLVHVVVDRLEIFDAVRLAADVGVDRQRAELGALFALGVEPVELIDGALEQVVALVMLDQHHRDVVEPV